MGSAVLLAPAFPEYCWNYANALAERMPVTLFCNRALFQSEVGEAGAINGRVQLRLVEYGTPGTILRVLREVVRLRPDFVHFQEATGRRAAAVNAVLTMLLKGRTRTVLTVHDPKPHSGNDSPIAAKTCSMGPSAARFTTRWDGQRHSSCSPACTGQSLDRHPRNAWRHRLGSSCSSAGWKRTRVSMSSPRHLSCCAPEAVHCA